MESLYGIEAKLDRIFNAIEEAEGEITEEQAKELEINEFNLKEKLTNYVHYIDILNSYIEGIKQKSTHLDTRKKVLENRIKKSKNIMLEAVEKYGAEGKNNKYIELDECRIYTKNSSCNIIEENRVESLNKCILILLKQSNGKPIPNTEEGILKEINDIYKLFYSNCDTFDTDNDSDKLFTLDDIKNYRLNITREYKLIDFIDNKLGIINDISSDDTVPSIYNVTSNISKSDIKKIITTNNNITIGYVENNNTLQIK